MTSGRNTNGEICGSSEFFRTELCKVKFPNKKSSALLDSNGMAERSSDFLTIPETNIAPKHGWLEYYSPIGEAYFQGLY